MRKSETILLLLKLQIVSTKVFMIYKHRPICLLLGDKMRCDKRHLLDCGLEDQSIDHVVYDYP